jgi:hypothetical protein
MFSYVCMYQAEKAARRQKATKKRYSRLQGGTRERYMSMCERMCVHAYVSAHVNCLQLISPDNARSVVHFFMLMYVWKSALVSSDASAVCSVTLQKQMECYIAKGMIVRFVHALRRNTRWKSLVVCRYTT